MCHFCRSECSKKLERVYSRDTCIYAIYTKLQGISSTSIPYMMYVYQQRIRSLAAELYKLYYRLSDNSVIMKKV